MVDKTCVITEGLHIIAQIPHIHPMPQGNQYLFVQDGRGGYVNDDFRHELALYTEGLLFTGCAHSGLENILSACPWPVHTVVGGFHSDITNDPYHWKNIHLCMFYNKYMIRLSR